MKKNEFSCDMDRDDTMFVNRRGDNIQFTLYNESEGDPIIADVALSKEKTSSLITYLQKLMK